VSDNEKDRPTPPGGSPAMPGMFSNRAGAARDAIPTADEGDALLDMLFDDAVKAPEPAPGGFDPGATVVNNPEPSLLGAAGHPRRTPTPPTPLPGSSPGVSYGEEASEGVFGDGDDALYAEADVGVEDEETAHRPVED